MSEDEYFLKVYLGYPKWKLINRASFYVRYMIKKKICCTHKKHRTSINSWLKIKKSS